MTIVIKKIIEFLERETHKDLLNRKYKLSSGREGDIVISFVKEKPFIFKGIKKDEFYKFLSIISAMKVNNFLIAAKIIEKNTYYLVDVSGIFVYGIKKVYVCEGNPKLNEEGKFLKYIVYRIDGRNYYYVQINMEVVLTKKGLEIRMGNEEREKITMEEYFYILEGYDKDEIFPVIEEMRKEFEKKAISKEFLTLTKKEIAISIMRTNDKFKFRAWYCSRKGKLPRVCENPYAYKAIAIYEQYYQGMKKLQILVFPNDAKIPNEV